MAHLPQIEQKLSSSITSLSSSLSSSLSLQQSLASIVESQFLQSICVCFYQFSNVRQTNEMDTCEVVLGVYSVCPAEVVGPVRLVGGWQGDDSSTGSLSVELKSIPPRQRITLRTTIKNPPSSLSSVHATPLVLAAVLSVPSPGNGTMLRHPVTLPVDLLHVLNKHIAPALFLSPRPKEGDVDRSERAGMHESEVVEGVPVVDVHTTLSVALAPRLHKVEWTVGDEWVCVQLGEERQGQYGPWCVDCVVRGSTEELTAAVATAAQKEV
eukprot:CAMPEP_0170735284 /NCGR_PEP_ID=MMETSP0437-20130122/3019_1 /TAXON_ID=0 /ORGANISM="Sexangularia sp." /LENGTH=267 /DNA_ID=CAMNT_0011073609 /DNA_START=22 /DNA_END=824 /DNA_ORIENTATION=-